MFNHIWVNTYIAGESELSLESNQGYPGWLLIDQRNSGRCSYVLARARCRFCIDEIAVLAALRVIMGEE